jgi:hypothetical protein
MGSPHTSLFNIAPWLNDPPVVVGLSYRPVLTNGKPTYIGIPPEGDIRWELGSRGTWGIGSYVLKGPGGALYDVPFNVYTLGKDAIRAWAARNYCAGQMKDHYGLSSTFSNVLSGCLNPNPAPYRRFKSHLFGGEVQAVPYYLGNKNQALWLVSVRTGAGQVATVSVYLSRQFSSQDLASNSNAKRLLDTSSTFFGIQAGSSEHLIRLQDQRRRIPGGAWAHGRLESGPDDHSEVLCSLPIRHTRTNSGVAKKCV